MDPIADSMRLRTPSVRSLESLKALIHHRKTSQAMFIKKLRFACFLYKHRLTDSIDNTTFLSSAFLKHSIAPRISRKS